MPNYDYVCTECNRKYELFHSITTLNEDRFCECKGLLKRHITGGTGFILKGEGWTRKNDYSQAD